MNCSSPLRIKNQYTGKWMYVPCRHCDACRINAANRKSAELTITCSNYKYLYLCTLTYDSAHVPFVVKGLPYIMRGDEIIEELDSPIDFDSKHLVNHPVDGAIGVLYYNDVQLFFKRVRKYITQHYGKQYNFKYFAIGEYGSKYGRPHHHIMFLSNNIGFEQFQNAVIKSWSLHDWHRFFKIDSQGKYINEGFKPCDKSTSQYVASYCNCSNNMLRVSQDKRFRQKTFRSKKMGFGVDSKLLETYRKDVGRIVNDVSFTDFERPFYYLQRTSKDNVSFSLLPKRYLDSCFHKPKGFSSLSFNDFLSRAYRIVETCEQCEKRGISKSTDFGNVHKTMKSDDLGFYRRYKKHGKLLGVTYSLGDYCHVMWKVLNYYNACLLREQMSNFTVMGKDNYYLELIDTDCHNLAKKERRLHFLVSDKCRKYLHKIDLSCPPYSKQNIIDYTRKYEPRLLVKHLNDRHNLLYSQS